MDWQPLNLYFRQTYDGGYRYLDRCGEFMLSANEQLDCVPEETKPTGAQMQIPEKATKINVDAVDLWVAQELPNMAGTFFADTVKTLSDLYHKHFNPSAVIRDGFAIRFYCPFQSEDSMLQVGRALGDSFNNSLARHIGMKSDYKKLDYYFVSGMKEFRVYIEPATFEKQNFPVQNPGFRALRKQKEYIERQNQLASKVDMKAPHAMTMLLDLKEHEPPAVKTLRNHYEDLLTKAEALKQFVQPK